MGPVIAAGIAAIGVIAAAWVTGRANRRQSDDVDQVVNDAQEGWEKLTEELRAEIARGHEECQERIDQAVEHTRNEARERELRYLGALEHLTDIMIRKGLVDPSELA